MAVNPLNVFLPALIILFICLLILNSYEYFINLVPFTNDSFARAIQMTVNNNPPTYLNDPIYFNAQSNLLAQLNLYTNIASDINNPAMLTIDMQNMPADQQANLLNNINTINTYNQNYMSSPEFMNNFNAINSSEVKYTNYNNLIRDIANNVPVYFKGSEIRLPPVLTSIGNYVPLSFASQFPAGTPSNDIINAYSTLPGFTYNLNSIKDSNNTPITSANALKPFDWIVKGVPMSNSGITGIPTSLPSYYTFPTSLSNISY
jgi:hypothetical protein